MRATPLLVAAAVLTVAGMSTLAGGADRVAAGPDADDRLLAAAASEERDGWLDGFDGRLYPDPETGCIRPWPGDAEDDLRREDVEARRFAPEGPAVLVQESPDGPWLDGPPDERLLDPWAPTFREPWPLCDHPSARVSDRLGDP
jgi:hypothetical protein